MAPGGGHWCPCPTVEAREHLAASEWVNIQRGAAPPKSGSETKAQGSPGAWGHSQLGLAKTAIMSCVIKGCRILINNGITWWWDRASGRIMTDCGKTVRPWASTSQALWAPGEVAGPAFPVFNKVPLVVVLRGGLARGEGLRRSKPSPRLPTSHLLPTPQPHPQIPGEK